MSRMLENRPSPDQSLLHAHSLDQNVRPHHIYSGKRKGGFVDFLFAIADDKHEQFQAALTHLTDGSITGSPIEVTYLGFISEGNQLGSDHPVVSTISDCGEPPRRIVSQIKTRHTHTEPNRDFDSYRLPNMFQGTLFSWHRGPKPWNLETYVGDPVYLYDRNVGAPSLQDIKYFRDTRIVPTYNSAGWDGLRFVAEEV